MLRIRLQRTGNKNNPTFRLVVTEKSNAAKGKSLELLGHYLPTRDPVTFEFNKERIDHWIKNGAIPTDTVARLLAKEGIKGLEKYMERYTKQKKRKEVEKEPAAAPADEAPKDEEKPVEEAPKEEKKEEEAPADEPKEEEEKPAEEPKKEEKPEEKEESSSADEATEDKDDKKEADA
ncbi:MAG: 30S ribosomal protein S16 [Candidatus Peribacteraceae bacterium]|jgi:small subunit ribosomal protein S16|nr:30S ribosomal protein S16 [bacterium]MDP6562009.1 30S ribosomal protein S16 [Candidatus Peribacteraceae bacterium]|tara:strand:+ start:21582 stop:22112 length:531 start_codon:yes stop_codon:yes gene_type:complete